MRAAFPVLLLLGILGVVQCAELGTEENPLSEDSDDADDGEEEEADEEESEGEEVETQDPESALDQYEDDGAGDHLTAEHLTKLHAKLDHNKDGKVHIDEIMKFAEQSRHAVAKKEIASIFDEIESTKDGHLSLEEHLAESEEFHEGDDAEKAKQKEHEIAKFKAADLDGDGKLDKEELVHMMHPETHPEVLELHLKEEMRKRDTDGDGRLSSKEWTPDASEHKQLAGEEDSHDPHAEFAKLDEDKDGFISMDELRHYESGRFHTEDAMRKLYELADLDGDSHLTAKEISRIHHQLEGHDAHPHLMDWAFHDEM